MTAVAAADGGRGCLLPPKVVIAGGGLAGLASAAALGQAGFAVDLLESRAFLGGRATSYPLQDEVIDNCQHVLLRCCVNLLDFYARLGMSDALHFHRSFHFIEPGGRVSTLERGRLPAPLHFAGAFLGLDFLSFREKAAVAGAMAAMMVEHGTRTDLDRITMLTWLREKRQPERAISRFWNQVLVSAINEDLGRMAASHGFQVFRHGFLASPDAYEMGIPVVPLGELYSEDAWRQRVPNVRIHFRTPVERMSAGGVLAGGRMWTGDAYVCALPFERVKAVAPEAGLSFEGWQHSPITGIHLWFDRAVTDLPHATLLDRTIQWFFNKGGGRYLQVVVSASRSLVEMPRQDVIDLAVRELGEFLPLVRQARLERAHVVKEVRATFSAVPGLERPPAESRVPRLFFAGDWTRTGWPATMEGAVRGGYLAAEAIMRSLGAPCSFLLPGTSLTAGRVD
jgi:squalene-associated FAD-dependent desaturase